MEQFDINKYVTVKQAAAYLEYTERYTRNLIAQGKLSSIMVGTARMVEKASIEQYKERR